MHRLFALLLGLVLTITVSGQTMAHALEPFAAMNPIQAAFAGHTAGDADEVQADADKGYPHHHAGCHEHAIGVPATAQRLPGRSPIALALKARDHAALAASDPGSLLRPPRA
ncbi:MAG TPA: hypothetical protein VGC10_03590 [Sphingomonas sp.]